MKAAKKGSKKLSVNSKVHLAKRILKEKDQGQEVNQTHRENGTLVFKLKNTKTIKLSGLGELILITTLMK